MRKDIVTTLRRLALPCALAAALSACGLAPHRGADPIRITIVGLNDYHGNLQTPGSFGVNTAVPAADRPAVGGAEYLAAYVERMRAQNPNTVVVGAGDLIGASPLISALFFDEPSVETLNRIGVEFSAVGNHEFDKGLAELRRLQAGGCRMANGAPHPNSCRGVGSAAPGTFDGARFQWLSANVVETATGHPVLPAYGMKDFQGVKVAFVGMTLEETPALVTPTGVAGLQFRDEADTVNALIPRLRAEGANVIVVLLHQGGVQASPGLNDINGCDGDLRNADGSDSDVRRIVSRLKDGVDLVISGHTHAAYNCSASTVDVRSANGVATGTPRPTGLPDAQGRLVPVTSASAFGRVLTEIDLAVDPRSRRPVSIMPVNRLVDRSDPAINAMIAADPGVRNVVEGYDALVAPLAGQVIGTIARPLPSRPDDAGEMPAGSLIADAQLQATQPAALGAAVMAFINPGGVRSPGFAVPAGAVASHGVSYATAFAVQPFGNSLVTMTLTAQQIKDLLEQQFAGCRGQTAQRIMQVSNGLKYAWSASAAPCARITSVVFTPTDVTRVPPVATGAPQVIVANGVVVDPGRTYRVTVNSFMASGGDGFTVLLGGTHMLGGAQDIDALVGYLSGGYKAPRAPYDPALPALALPRITRLP